MVISRSITFLNQKIRNKWDKTRKINYFSVLDILRELTGIENPANFWLETRLRILNDGGYNLSKDCRTFKNVEMADRRTIFRIIQSVPSRNAERIKLWLAKVGDERLQEMVDPEIALNRARRFWQKSGRTPRWIQQRMMGQEIRNKLTDYWKDHGVAEGKEYAILTNIIHEEWSGLTVKGHKELKGLKQQNLRDHMSDAEIIFTALAELSTRQIAESERTTGFNENKIPAIKGGRIAKNARLELEQKTGKKIVTNQNFLPINNKQKELR